MNTKLPLRVLCPTLLALFAAGCDRPPPHLQEAASARSPSASSASVNVERWLGRWSGPEATFLQLSRNGDRYEVTIQDLDGPRTYPGKAAGDHLEFERNGKVESIRATSGQETGMKWLLEKQNCLTIRAGEGFCRD